VNVGVMTLAQISSMFDKWNENIKRSLSIGLIKHFQVEGWHCLPNKPHTSTE